MNKSTSPQVSIIIPVYNVEQYLSQCIESCINQTLNDIEIILIDDGSTDSSGKICDEYVNKDKRITVLHKINRGVGEARNDGIDLSKGEYIYFVDGDDYIQNNLIEKCIEFNTDFSFDILIFGYNKVDIANKVTKKKLPPFKRLFNVSKEKSELAKILSFGVGLSVWDKLIKSDLIKKNKIRFDNKKRGEDYTFVVKCFNCSNQIISINNSLYNYRIFFNSNGKFDDKIFENHIANYKLFRGLFNEKENEQLIFLSNLCISWFLIIVPLNLTASKNINRLQILESLNMLYLDEDIKLWLAEIANSKLILRHKLLLTLYRYGSTSIFFFSGSLFNFLRKKIGIRL